MYVANIGLGERSPMALDGWHLWRFGENPRLATPARSFTFTFPSGNETGQIQG